MATKRCLTLRPALSARAVNPPKNGSATMTPAERRNWRRSVVRDMWFMALHGLRTGKRVAARDFLNQRAETVVCLPHFVDTCVDCRAVREALAAAKAIGQQFLGDAAGDALWVTLEQGLALPDVAKCLARRQLARTIDRQAEL